MATTEKSRSTPSRAAENERRVAHSDKSPGRDLVEYLKGYAREKPEMAALWCFGIGFVVGWRLKPW
ncbi:MAG: hypothetical protein KY476_13015 [Planctomycetes bacterium]|nr:hypothetical protein [Planctomycetota bacterium]